MDKTRKRIENGFEKLSLWTFQWRWPVLLLGVVLTGLAINQLPHLKLDTSNESFFHKDDPTLLQYEQFLEEFDRDEIIVVGIQTENIFKEDFLTRLSALHEKLESTLPYLDEIISLKNVVSIYGRGDELVVEDLLETWPSSDAAMQQLENTVLNHPVYPNLLVAKDKTFTTLIIRPQVYNGQTGTIDLQTAFDESSESENKGEKLTPEQIHALIADIRDTLTSFESPEFRTYVAGVIVVTDDIMQALNTDIPQFTTYAIILISVFLFILYRRISGIILPLTIVLLSLMATLGIMAASNTSFTVFTQILPSFLLAVGIGNSIHLLTIFYRRVNEINDKKAAMQYAMGHSGLAMLMTSITTAGGLLSFSTAEMAPIGDLGIFGAVGVILTLLYTILFLPALIAVIPIRSRATHNESNTNKLIDGILIRFSDIAVYHPGKVIIGFLIVSLIAVYGISQLRFYYNTVAWFPDGHPIKTATHVLDDKMKGTMNIEVILDTRQTNGIKDTVFLNKLDELQSHLDVLKDDAVSVGNSYSVRETLKLIHKALNENQENYYVIPDSNEAIAQEILLFENSGGDELERQLNSDFSKARITLTVPWDSAETYVAFVKKIEQEIDKVFGPDHNHYVTGMVMLYTRTSDAAIHSMSKSYLIAFFVIASLMMLMLWSMRVGLVAMLPNLFPIAVALGFMGLMGFPLDLSSILVGSIAIGLSVDDTIHFMHHFRRYFAETNNAKEAIHRTLLTSGRAMLFTTIVLTLGFLIFTLSTLNNLDSFGFVTASAIVLALLADLLLAPALMMVLTRQASFCRCLKG